MPLLPLPFYNRPVLQVANDLIGCYLVREIGGKVERFLITETEVYDGEKDLACHASKGRTKRTEVMFSQGGHIYIYLIYGMYWMLNIVTGPKDYPSAVLIRGLKNIEGPGKVTKRLKIDKNLNGKVLGKKIGLWVEGRDTGLKIKMKKLTRVGVDYAGPVWSKKKWRFVLVSVYKK